MAKDITLIERKYDPDNMKYYHADNVSGHEWALGEGNYCARIVAWIQEAECLVCHEQQICLHMDSSDDEYGPGRLCRSCVNLLFEKREGISGDQDFIDDRVE